MAVYLVADYDTHLSPRPWGDCACSRCMEWMLQDLENCTEKLSEHPDTEIICNGLSRWTVWVPSPCTRLSQFGFISPVGIDSDTEKYLSKKSVINWWYPTLNSLHPIKIIGDGNCLPHAVSMALWGIQDINMTLRHLLYLTLLGSDSNLFCDRWKREREWQNSLIPDGGLQYSEEEWKKEWSILVSSAEDHRRDFNSHKPSLPYESLEELHIFVLANILRRPIIVLAEPVISSFMDGSAIAQNNFVGIYLPLLWPAKLCYTYPILLGFLFNHFEPLVSRLPHSFQTAAYKRWFIGNVVPLVTASQEMLHIHFTLAQEESKLHEVVQNYLNVSEVSFLTKGGTTEQLLVAELSDPRYLVEYTRDYVRERSLSKDELKLLVVDKELIYDRLEDAPARENCTSIKFVTCLDIQGFIEQAPLLINRKTMKAKKFNMIVRKLIAKVKQLGPRLTIRSLEETIQDMKDLMDASAQLDSELTSDPNYKKTAASALPCRRCSCLCHDGANAGCKHSHNTGHSLTDLDEYTDKDPDKYTDTHTGRRTDTHTRSHRQTDWLTGRHDERHTNTHVEGHTHCHTNRDRPTFNEYGIVERLSKDNNNASTGKTLLPVRRRNWSETEPDSSNTMPQMIKCKNDGCDRQRMEDNIHCRVCDFQQKVTAHAMQLIQSDFPDQNNSSLLENDKTPEMLGHSQSASYKLLQPAMNADLKDLSFSGNFEPYLKSADTSSPEIPSKLSSLTSELSNEGLYEPISGRRYLQIERTQSDNVLQISLDADLESSAGHGDMINSHDLVDEDEHLEGNKITSPDPSAVKNSVIVAHVNQQKILSESDDTSSLPTWSPPLFKSQEEPDRQLSLR